MFLRSDGIYIYIVTDFSLNPRRDALQQCWMASAGWCEPSSFPIEKEYFRVGRDADNELRISGDEFVSGHYASFRYQAGSLFLSDDGSRNGTFSTKRK
jgi:FHA domain